MLLVIAGCQAKAPSTSNDRTTCVFEPITEEALVPIDPTETQANETECLSRIRLRMIDPTSEEALDEALEDVKDLPKRSSPCFSKGDWQLMISQLARAAIAAMAEAAPNDELLAQKVFRAKQLFMLDTDSQSLYLTQTTIKLIHLYQLMNHGYALSRPLSFRDAHRQLSAIEPTKDTEDLIRQVHEAILREAIVYQYQHRLESDPDLDAVIGVYPFDRVSDRMEFAKSIVDRFDASETRALPKSFLSDACHDAECRSKLLVYLVAPNADEDEDYVEALDRRAKTYVNAGYDVTEVNAAAVQDLIEGDQFSDALAYAGKHFDKAYVANTETRIMKIMRSRGCYSVMENPDGHKYSLFDFKRGCDDSFDIEEDETEDN